MEKFYVYILKSEKDNKNYTGYTEDLVRRLEDHNQGRVKSTKNRRPLKLIHTEIFKDKATAMKREKFLKSRSGRRELAIINQN